MASTIKTKDFVTLRSRKRASGLEALYLDICVDGKRKSEYLKLYLTGGKSREDKARDKETMRQAEIIRAQRVMEVQEQRYGLRNHASKDVLFYPYFDRLMETKTGETKAVWAYTKLKILAYCPDKKLRLSDITPAWVREFCNFLDVADNKSNKVSGIKIKGSTKKIYFSKLKATLKRAFKDELILRNPAAGQDNFKEEPREKQFLTVEELKKLHATPTKHTTTRRMFLLSCLTGLRWSDLQNLRWKNIHTDGERTWISLNQQKTKSPVTIFLDSQALELIGTPSSDQNETVFKKFHFNTCSGQLKRWVKKAGIDKHITFHCARHTFATLMLSNGVDIYTVSKLLGHQSVKTTQVYLRLVDEKRVEAMEKLPKFM